MHPQADKLSQKIISLLAEATEPLETKEIEGLLPQATHIKILYRLNRLRGDGLLKGKPVGSGKGAWIWWNIGIFAADKSSFENNALSKGVLNKISVK